MQFFGCIGLIFAALTVQARLSDAGSRINPCSRGIPNFSECMERAIDEMIAAIAPGFESYEIPPIEPISLKIVEIKPIKGQISLHQIYKNAKLEGLTKGFKSSNFDIDFDKLIIRFDTWHPQVNFVGNFSLQGKVMFLPVQRNGYSNITLEALRTKQTIYCEEYEIGDQTFLRIKKYDLELEPKNVVMDFVDVPQRTGLMSSIMARTLKRNSKLFFTELRSSYAKKFSQIFEQITQRAFSHIPMDEIFSN